MAELQTNRIFQYLIIRLEGKKLISELKPSDDGVAAQPDEVSNIRTDTVTVADGSV